MLALCGLFGVEGGLERGQGRGGMGETNLGCAGSCRSGIGVTAASSSSSSSSSSFQHPPPLPGLSSSCCTGNLGAVLIAAAAAGLVGWRGRGGEGAAWVCEGGF